MVAQNYNFALVYRAPGVRDELVTTLFQNEDEIANKINWIRGLKEKRWFTLIPQDDFELSKAIVRAIQKKHIRDDDKRLLRMRIKQTTANAEIEELEKSLNDRRQKLSAAI